MIEGNIEIEEVDIALVGYLAGKTCFINKIINGSFEQTLITTGYDKFHKNWKLSNGKTIKLSLWDTPGNERFQTAAFTRVPISHGVIIMYDLTSERSFKNSLNWINEIREYKEDFPIILVGNMCDIKDYYSFKDEGKELAKKYNCHFYESSIKIGINIEEPINDLIEQILKYREENKDKDNIKNIKSDIKTKKSKYNKKKISVKENIKKESNKEINEIKNKNLPNKNLNERNFYSKIYSNYLSY